MVVGVLRLDLQLYSPQSLKDKRSLVKRLLGRCRERFPVSCAEVGAQELWQRSELGFAVVEQSAAAVQALFEKVEEEILRQGEVEILDRDLELLHYQ
jgi:uncharacterized protein